MKIKTILESSPESFDAKVNEFGKNNDVKFTQTQHEATFTGSHIVRKFRATIFYAEK